MARKSKGKASSGSATGQTDVDEGVGEDDDYNAVTPAHFFINVGQKKYRAIGLKDCWALQTWQEVKNENALVPSGWREFKFFTDLGSLAGKIFDMRLKNADVSTLQELSEAAKAIRIEVRNEFRL